MICGNMIRSAKNKPIYRLSVVLCACVAGCGGDSGVAPVAGELTLDGKPVADASITFMPRAGGRPSYGTTDSNGAFELTTFEPEDGALVGVHTVTVTAIDESISQNAETIDEELGSLAESSTANRPAKWRVPKVYSHPDTSGLDFEVKPGVRNSAVLRLQSK